MSFQLVYGDHEVSLPLNFESHIEDRLVAILYGPSEPSEHAELRRRKLSGQIVDLITAMLDSNVVPPTDKQLKYAVAIARELSLQLPADVLQNRDAMTSFLEMHADTYRRRKSLAAGER